MMLKCLYGYYFEEGRLIVSKFLQIQADQRANVKLPRLKIMYVISFSSIYLIDCPLYL